MELLEQEKLMLVIVGDGPARQDLEQAVKELEIEDHVIFTGMVPPDQVQNYYQIADVFVCASTSETQGLTYIEAAANALPLLCRRDPCLENVLEDGKIRPPLNSIAGLGNVAAESIYQARCEEPFECIEDMQARSKIGKSVTELLEKFGCLKGMTKSNQLSLFI